jgi:type 1 glutamine amidotransferase
VREATSLILTRVHKRPGFLFVRFYTIYIAGNLAFLRAESCGDATHDVDPVTTRSIATNMKIIFKQERGLKYKRVLLLSASFLLLLTIYATGQNLPKALILTGNGNVPSYKNGYPPWIHEFHNEKVIEILKNTVTVDVTEDLNMLRPEVLSQYDLVVSNSLFLTPTEEQLDALYQFVANGKSYLTLHCGILSLLNWNRYEEFIGGIFIGGPSSVPHQFNVVTDNVEFWGYQYAFRERKEHPVSLVADDFDTKDELYHFQPSVRDFHVIARAENLPVMWWHPVGKGKVMTLTLGHDEEAKNNPGYQSLLKGGVQWLTGMPLIYGKEPKVVSTRDRTYKNFMALRAISDENNLKSAIFKIHDNDSRELFSAEATPEGMVSIALSGKTGNGSFSIKATENNRYSSLATYNVRIVQDGTGDIAAYHGNVASSSSNENQSSVFNADNVLDGDRSTRWGSSFTDAAWLLIDLQKNYNVGKLNLFWESAFASEYDITGSKDGKSWQTLSVVKGGDGDEDAFNFSSVQIRYIKINMTKRARDKFGYSLYDVEVYQGL